MNSPQRVVFDCNIFFQALISPAGPAGQALDAVVEGRCILFVSEYVLYELRVITARPQLVTRFSLNADRVTLFLDSIAEIAIKLVKVPAVFEFPRDPKDAHYVDLAVAMKAKLIVSRDLDLLSLGDPATREGRDFQVRFPERQILTPTELLNILSQE